MLCLSLLVCSVPGAFAEESNVGNSQPPVVSDEGNTELPVPDAPPAPTVQSVTCKQIVLNPTEGCEYALVPSDGSLTGPVLWQQSPVFADVAVNTAYTAYQRYAATETHQTSAASVGLVVIPTVLLFADRKALAMVDYPLLLTFVFFFIFSGNMSRIGAVKELLSALLSKSVLLFGVLSCQVISNVPTAILLSRFTSNYSDLLLSVNIGGVGTLVASLARLITLREYQKDGLGHTAKYIGMFSALNFGFLGLLVGLELILKAI